ncbi:MAG: hypothetical protein KGL39_11540 [Patescibacteria group bacterium]|nr:hypothetical protein [Patescibacteria group bacterium]
MIQGIASDWSTANAKLAKMPIYVFSILPNDSVVTPNPQVWYTTHNLNNYGITGSLPSFSTLLKTPAGSTQTVDIMNGTSSIGELQCEVIDPSGAVMAYIGANVLEGATCTLSVGYPGIAWSSFVVLHTYQIYKIIPSKDYTSWLFISRDRQINEKLMVVYNPANGDQISTSNPWIVQGTAPEVILQVWLWGLGLPLDTVDLAGLWALNSAGVGLFPSRPFCFVITQAFEAKQWLEEQIYKPCGLYPLVNNLGQLGAQPSRPPAAGPSPVITLDVTNVTVLPEWDRQPILNEVVYQADQDATGGFGSYQVYVQGGSVSQYGCAGQLTINSAGLRSAYGAQAFCEDVADRLFSRFAGAPENLKGGAPVLQVEAFLMTIPVWVGDYVYLTYALMPNPFTGTNGVTNRVYEVIDRTPDYANGKMRFKLLDTGITGLAAAATVGTAVVGTARVF